MDTLSRALDVTGGPSALARVLEIPAVTVRKWKQRGAIPAAFAAAVAAIVSDAPAEAAEPLGVADLEARASSVRVLEADRQARARAARERAEAEARREAEEAASSILDALPADRADATAWLTQHVGAGASAGRGVAILRVDPVAFAAMTPLVRGRALAWQGARGEAWFVVLAGDRAPGPGPEKHTSWVDAAPAPRSGPLASLHGGRAPHADDFESWCSGAPAPAVQERCYRPAEDEAYPLGAAMAGINPFAVAYALARFPR